MGRSKRQPDPLPLDQQSDSEEEKTPKKNKKQNKKHKKEEKEKKFDIKDCLWYEEFGYLWAKNWCGCTDNSMCDPCSRDEIRQRREWEEMIDHHNDWLFARRALWAPWML